MRYIALYTGEGVGCDYTIACNKDFEVFEADNDLEAIAHCKDRWKERSEPGIESIRLFTLGHTDREIKVFVPDWNAEKSRLENEEVERKKALKEAALSKLSPEELEAFGYSSKLKKSRND